VGLLNTRARCWIRKLTWPTRLNFPSFVPETMNLLHLFKSLQKQQRGLAVVLDEFATRRAW